jgi:hypothetical protein
VLCVFLAIGAKTISALADGTLDYDAAACGRGRQREEPRDFDAFAPQFAERDGGGPLG